MNTPLTVSLLLCTSLTVSLLLCTSLHLCCQVNGRRYQNLASKLGVRPGTLPSIVLVSVANETYHVMSSETAVTLESITAFVDEFLEGTLEPTLRSADAPLHEEGPVRTLVARDFRRRVYDSPKDVLVLFR
jgi:protein disulfide-isomerase A1